MHAQVAWDDGHGDASILPRTSLHITPMEEKPSIASASSLAMASRDMSLDYRPSVDIRLGARNGQEPTLPGLLAHGAEQSEGERTAATHMPGIQSAFAAASASPQSTSSPFAVMAGLAPFTGAPACCHRCMLAHKRYKEDACRGKTGQVL